MTRIIRNTIIILGLFFWSHSLIAQIAADTSSSSVEKLDVVIKGAQGVSVESALAFIKIRAGNPYSQTLIDQSIRALYATGNYDYIEVKRKELSPGELGITFILYPKYRISEICFDGNCNASNRKLIKMIESKVGETLSESLINRDAITLFEHYQKKGYSQITVTPEVEKDPECGTGKITFHINEGEKIKIKAICFSGVECYESSDLRDKMHTKKWNWFSWLTSTGRFEEDLFREDLEILREYFMDEGYLDVKIDKKTIEFDYPKPCELFICIPIELGECYYIGDIKISGNTLFETCRIEDVLCVEKGDVASPTCIEQTSKAIHDFYGQFGYLETYVSIIRTPNTTTGAIDLEFKIHESEKFYVESISIQGNTKTKSTVILRELAIAPGDVFDTVRTETSKQRLENLGFFDQVMVGPESTNIPGRKNLRISVEEGKTGFFNFGAGFSTLESLMGTFEFTQSNFDLFGWRTKFQGGGQKFRLSASVGSRSSHYILSYENPWVFERRLAFGFDIFRDTQQYTSTRYHQARTGFDVYFRRRLFELVDARLGYVFEQVNINHVQPSAPQSIKNEAGNRTVSKGQFSLLRDTRDNFIFPNCGSRLEFITELAGGVFGGETKYVRIEGRAAKWWQICETNKQVFSLAGRTGTVPGYDDSTVPFFDMYFLGGPDNMRGFRVNDVGPKSLIGEPLGGQTYAFGTAEYSLEVVSPLRAAVFYDIGFVNSPDFHWAATNYNSDVGFGLRLFALGAPLRLDFGFPLRHDDFNQNGMRINFSVGVVF